MPPGKMSKSAARVKRRIHPERFDGMDEANGQHEHSGPGKHSSQTPRQNALPMAVHASAPELLTIIEEGPSEVGKGELSA